MENRCISCGEIIPEGMQVCPGCEIAPRMPCWHEWVFIGLRKEEEGIYIVSRCNLCGRHRMKLMKPSKKGN